MNQNIASVIGLLFGVSEMLLTIAKRRGQRDAAADAGSLWLIWGVVGASIGAAFFVARAFPEGTFRDVDFARVVGIAIFIAGAALRWHAAPLAGTRCCSG